MSGGIAAITETSAAQHSVLGILILDVYLQMLTIDTISPGGGSVPLEAATAEPSLRPF